jgi:glycosyltransferase involved in cell wall biosynthesis
MKILFLAVNKSSFINRDYEILLSEHEVKFMVASSLSFMKTIHNLFESDLLFCWFASLNFLIPILIAKILKKKIIIVAGGYDVAKVKSLNYGSMSSFWRGEFVKIILTMADKVLSVSKSNNQEIIDNCKISPNKIILIYHGFEIGEFPKSARRENNIITIGLLDKNTYLRKGFDRFINLAKSLPEIEFFIIGKYDQTFINGIVMPSNVTLTGFLTKEELNKLIISSKIYIQLSRHEGFGASVAESMLLGCIPVVSDVYALPEVINNCGLLIKNPDDTNFYAKLVKDLLQNFSIEKSYQCYDQIQNHFAIGTRKQKILVLLRNYNTN